MGNVNFKQLAIDATSLSELMAGRTKIDTADIVAKYPEGITVTAVDVVEYEKDGKPIEYPVMLFKENPKAFYAGGIILKKITQAWVAPFDGDYNAMSAELEAQGGVRIKLEVGRSKNGNSITNVIL